MPNIKPISDLRNYTEVLHDVAVGAPVFLTKNGRGRYAIVDMQDYERTQATLRLMNELAKGRKSGEEKGWLTLEAVENISESQMNNLHLSDEAQADLAGIKSYIAKNLENPSAAISTVRNITKDIRRLREHSLIGASLSSIADVESDYRFLVTGSYLTFYRVLDNDVYVDRVLYGRRDYLRILFGDVQDDETNE